MAKETGKNQNPSTKAKAGGLSGNSFKGAADGDVLAISTTESLSTHRDQQRQSTSKIFDHIFEDNENALAAVQRAKPQIITLIEKIHTNMKKGGRVFYIGAGSAGRYGVVDAVECPPTFGADDEFIGLIAGGDGAMRKSVEGAEDNPHLAWQEIQEFDPQPHDVVIGIAASGRTPYTVGGIAAARKHGLLTGGISCNEDSALEVAAEYPVVAVVGAAPVSGSTRMGAGSAQKIITNMISTAIFVKLGYVYDNIMVNMKLSNEKLVTRAMRNVTHILNVDNKNDSPVNEEQTARIIANVMATKADLKQDTRVIDILQVFAKNGHKKANAILTECADLGNKHAQQAKEFLGHNVVSSSKGTKRAIPIVPPNVN